MWIIEDTRQKKDLHTLKNEYWSEHGIGVIRSALPFGDYITAPRIAVDTKQNIKEIAANMCGAVREKKRFREECKKAKEAGCILVFLIEEEQYGSIDDLYGEQIYIHSGVIIPGDQLALAMNTMSGRYGCRFEFCKPEEAGQRVVELLR